MDSNRLVVGKVYKNKTWNYLAPCLRFFGDDFMDKFNAIKVFGLGLADGNTLANHKGRCIYLMVDTLHKPTSVARFLEYVKYQEYFVKDYVAGSVLEKSRRKMVVLELPARLNKTYDAFIAGKYSLMFNNAQIKKFFTDGSRREFAKIFKKDMKALGDHIKKINKEFNCNLTPSDCLHHEYDTPPEIEEEIFNSSPCDMMFVSSLEEFKIKEEV